MQAQGGYAFDLGSDFSVATGYRLDNAKVGLCATLSDPNYYGYGLARFKSINMWEIQLNGIGAITDNFYIRGMADYAVVLGGKYRDTGVFDMLSDPYNATLGANYYTCCGCVCEECPPCNCDCGDKVYRQTVASRGALKGQAWDAATAIGYMFHLSDEFGMGPALGWSFNQQKYRTTEGAFGPLQLQYRAVPCAPDFYVDNLFLISGTPEGSSLFIGELTAESQQQCQADPDFIRNILGENPCSDVSVGCEAPCMGFGFCANDTIYRARWNGPFLGLDFFWRITQRWTMLFGYEIHLQRLNGKIITLGGDDCCACDCCPSFLDSRASYLNQTVDEVLSSKAIPGECVSFCPACITWNKWGWGQVFYANASYMCNDNWYVGLMADFTMASVNGCAAVDPCESCCTVYNGAARDPVTTAATLGAVGDNPVWSAATFQKARWNSFVAKVSVGYLF